MASTHKSIRSGTANKRPTTSIADGQIALNTNVASPGLYFKDSTGASIIKIGPVHVGTTAPNVAPAGSSGNSTGEAWLDTSLTPNGWKVWTGAAWVNATPAGSATVQGLLELATNAETQAGSDAVRVVTPAGLQSKVSDSTSTTSSTTIASSTAVKSAYDLANAALPKSGGTVTGNLEIGTSGSLSFEGATADAFETTLAVVDPTADRTITLPNTTGTVVTTGDTGSVTSTMILDGTIVNADINASAAIAGTKISPNFGSQTVTTTGVINPALGTAAAPSVAFTGDPNTGIYSPGADQVAISTNGSERAQIDNAGTTTLTSATATAPFIAKISTSEVARIDSSGRLLVGTSTALANVYVGASALTPQFQLEGNSGSTAALSITRQTGAAANIILQRGVTGTPVISGNTVGQINFNGFDGTNFRNAAQITAEVDGTPGTNDMPGRIVLSTTAAGSATPTERFRITNDGVIAYNQPAPATYAAAATLTVADLKTRIITYTGTAATLTLPTGTLTEGGFSDIYTNIAFEWSVINTGAGICTIGAGTAHTIVGSTTVAIGASARFASRRTAANTFVTYRLS